MVSPEALNLRPIDYEDLGDLTAITQRRRFVRPFLDVGFRLAHSESIPNRRALCERLGLRNQMSGNQLFKVKAEFALRIAQ